MFTHTSFSVQFASMCMCAESGVIMNDYATCTPHIHVQNQVSLSNYMIFVTFFIY